MVSIFFLFSISSRLCYVENFFLRGASQDDRSTEQSEDEGSGLLGVTTTTQLDAATKSPSPTTDRECTSEGIRGGFTPSHTYIHTSHHVQSMVKND